MLWLLPGLLLVTLRRDSRFPRPLWDVARFWSILTLALCLGVMTTIVQAELTDWSTVFHDIFAYVLLAAVTTVLVALPDATRRLYHIQWMTALFGAALLSMQVASAWGLFAVRGVEPWYWERMRGWCDNPNQLALHGLVVGLLALELVEREARLERKLLASTCAAISLGVGWLALSNAYSGVVLASFVVFALLKATRAIGRAERRRFPAVALVTVALAAVTFASCVLAPALDARSNPFLKAGELVGRKGEDEGAEAALRVYLWGHAVERGLDAWMLGLGPGAHLKIPTSILAGRRGSDEPMNLYVPKAGLAPNFEAHNTVLEIFVQGGALAAGSFLWIYGLAIVRAWKAGLDGLLTLLFAIMAYGSFHVVFRHPIVWFLICVALTADRRFRAHPTAMRAPSPREMVVSPIYHAPKRAAIDARPAWRV